ncbi:MAG: DUF5103 domain-containing protein [Bacteroidales bacterium]|nr:DUF5103 domain-containing protein [Bacteroidales bacterium]
MKIPALLKQISIVILLTPIGVFGLTTNEKYYLDTIYNRIFETDIRSVLIRSATWELASAVIEAGSDQKLELRFDDLSADKRSFGYTLVHCDANWRLSDLSPGEYLTGFGQGVIRESSSSFNTTLDFTHYRLIFPEEDCMPVLSGNYALVVYEEHDPDKILFTRRFYVTEKTIQVTGRIKQPPPGEYTETGQQLDLTISFDDKQIRDPLNDITVVIVQNKRDDAAVMPGKPSFFKPGQLEYADHPFALFSGGNEFRSMDIKSMKYQSENIAAIDFRNPYYHVILKTDEDREGKPYFSKTDFNGGYYIDREKADDRHTEADYIFVHFTFAPPAFYSGENVYVAGDFSDWTAQDWNKMRFNPANGCFEAVLLLKQGMYDYCYALEDRTGALDPGIFEGNHYETANEYAVLVYYHDRHSRYDRLLSYYPMK